VLIDNIHTPAHHDLFEKAGILHRDISVGNLMVNASNPQEGVLIDFDLAVRVDNNGDPMDGDDLPPAGTLVFRAGDLVTKDIPKKAYYRHDLESFFFVLMWIEAHYKNGRLMPEPDTRFINLDFFDSWKTTQDVRLGFFYDKSEMIPACSLRDEWLVPLHQLFREAWIARRSAMWLEEEPLDPQTLGHRLVYERFKSVLDKS
jgi:serine/threonine protein kinase